MQLSQTYLLGGQMDVHGLHPNLFANPIFKTSDSYSLNLPQGGCIGAYTREFYIGL